MIIKIVDTCMDYQVRMLVRNLKTILNIVQVIGPFLVIIIFIALLIKLNKTSNNKRIKAKRRNKIKKEIKGKIKKTIIVLLILLTLPSIINMSIEELDDRFQFSTCWNYDDIEIKLDKELMNHDNKIEKKNEFNKNKSRIVFLGDSRTVHMYSYLAGVDLKSGNFVEGKVHYIDNEYYICKSGMGLSWMDRVGVSVAEDYIEDGTALVILMGVNDLYNLNEYVKYINNKYKDWVNKGAVIYFVSVNPTGDEFDYLNDRIVKFNEGMKQGLNNNIKYIDSYSYLKENGYKLRDGLHYDEETSKKIYEYVKSQL